MDTYGNIQLKSVDMCMDVHCKCGEHSHVDAEFFYYFQCSACKRKYSVGSTVVFTELTKNQAHLLQGVDFITGETA